MVGQYRTYMSGMRSASGSPTPTFERRSLCFEFEQRHRGPGRWLEVDGQQRQAGVPFVKAEGAGCVSRERVLACGPSRDLARLRQPFSLAAALVLVERGKRLACPSRNIGWSPDWCSRSATPRVQRARQTTPAGTPCAPDSRERRSRHSRDTTRPVLVRQAVLVAVHTSFAWLRE